MLSALRSRATAPQGKTQPRQRSATPEDLKGLPNTPPAAADEATLRSFSELYGNPQAMSAKLVLVVIASVALNVGQGFTISSLVPLHKPIPYIIQTTDKGVVAQVVRASDFRPDKAMMKSALNRWVELMMTIDPYRTQVNHRESLNYVRGNAISEHTAFLNREKPYARLQSVPTLTRLVDAERTYDVSKDGIAFAFFSTTERSATSPEPVLKKWRLTVHYGIVPPADEQEILNNPTGMQITHFELIEVNQ